MPYFCFQYFLWYFDLLCHLLLRKWKKNFFLSELLLMFLETQQKPSCRHSLTMPNMAALSILLVSFVFNKGAKFPLLGLKHILKSKRKLCLVWNFKPECKTSEHWVFIFLTHLADGWEVMFAVYFLNISICEDVVQNMVFLQMSKTMSEEYKQHSLYSGRTLEIGGPLLT